MTVVIVIVKVIGAIILIMFGTAGISAILGHGGIQDRLRMQREFDQLSEWEEEPEFPPSMRVDANTWIWSISLLVIDFCAIGGAIYLVVSIFT